MITGMHSVVRDHLAKQGNPPQIDNPGLDKLFIDAETTEKLKVRLCEVNANIAEYFKDPEFLETW